MGSGTWLCLAATVAVAASVGGAGTWEHTRHSATPAACNPSPENKGCSPPVGDRWDQWSMAASTYAYCYAGCHMPWFLENREKYNLGAYAGVVGVDHYWTGQGVPCGADGEPHEFDMQDALATQWKSAFPGLKFLSYRIQSAVPYDKVVSDKIKASPDFFVRWVHKPGSTQKANGSVCYNYLSPCFNDPHRINNPEHNCTSEIRAAAYDFKNAAVGEWYLENVIYRALKAADGIWLDGGGYDNGAWMCSGIGGGYGADNSPHNLDEIEQFCVGMESISRRARQGIIAKGGWDGLGCFDFLGVEGLPTAADPPAVCASKLQTRALWAANHSNYNAVVAYGYDTGPGGYNDTTAAGAVAAFLIMRGQHWFFGMGAQRPCNPKHYPVSGRCHSDGCGKQCNASNNVLAPSTAKLLVTDYGRPLGAIEPVANKPNVFFRRYKGAKVTLDCNDFSGHFLPTTDGTTAVPEVWDGGATKQTQKHVETDEDTRYGLGGSDAAATADDDDEEEEEEEEEEEVPFDASNF